ncbi:carbon catabolite repressor protein 4 homolog 1 [Morus notabilis]|uniref:carbon catabolite repressor protein 4 homolog 1 n=1 Tax=Morus notabilis TaxID=981085 RepID=UPI000CED0569|nr:carbon catabolite repressor protein 4 homolog 1 [Morus notabilis]
MYKKKTKELYTANRNIMDGCATFYRSTLFKETAKYELEFDKTALAFVEALEPQLRSEGSFRLLKGNGMLVAILEIRDNERFCDVFPSRICVANTHIHADSNIPDVKLSRIVSLINRLEEIVHPQIPLLICGDFNSLPTSDSYTFVVTVSCDIVDNEKQDPLGIFNHQRLQHSLHLYVDKAACKLRSHIENEPNWAFSEDEAYNTI